MDKTAVVPSLSSESDSHHPNAPLASLALAALGIIYGDIGTSPLYTIRECFGGTHGISTSQGNVLGILSMVFWSLIFVVSIKYVHLVPKFGHCAGHCGLT